MKTVLESILLLFVILAFSACGSDFDNNDDLAIFKYNESAGILTLDPIYAKDLPHIWACNQLYNSLVAFDDSMNLRPALAEKWSLSDDGTIYTFSLRQGVAFHQDKAFDGPRYVKAQDVVYSFNRVVNRSLNSPGAWIFSAVKHDSTGYAFKALNDSTLQIELQNPFPPFLGILSMTYASVVPSEAVEYYGADFRKHPVGTGPFAFQYWKENVKLVMRKNPNYFEVVNGQRLPYIDAVSISFLIDKQVAFLEFIKGKFDFMSGIDARYKDELLTHDGDLKKKYDDKIYLITEPYLNTEYLSFFIDAADTIGAERSKAMRQAVSYSIDRDKMLRYLRNGIGTAGTGGIIPAGLPAYQAGIGYSYDLKKAQKIVNDNHLNGYTLHLSTTADYADIGKFVQSQITSAGLGCDMEVMSSASMRSMRANGSLSFFRSSWVADYPDAENYLSLFTTSNFAPIGPNYTHYANPLFDKYYERALSVTSDTERLRYYEQMDSLMMQDAPVVVLFYDEVLRFVNKRVTGLGSNPINLLNLKNVQIKNQ